MQLIGQIYAQIQGTENLVKYWSIGAVNRAICGLAALSPQESNFVSHIHSSDFSVHEHMAA